MIETQINSLKAGSDSCLILVNNVSLLNPTLLEKVNQLIVESGHAVAGRKPGTPLRERCDSFNAETDVHCPKDVNLLWDAMRCMLRAAGLPASKHKRLIHFVQLVLNYTKCGGKASHDHKMLMEFEQNG